MSDIIDFNSSEQMKKRLKLKEAEEIEMFKREIEEMENQLSAIESYIFTFPKKQIDTNSIVAIGDIPKGIISMKLQWTNSEKIFARWRKYRGNSELCKTITIELPIDRRDFSKILKENNIGKYWWVLEYDSPYYSIDRLCHYTYYPTTINYLAFVLAKKTEEELKKMERCCRLLSSALSLSFPASEDLIKLVNYFESEYIDGLSDDELRGKIREYFYNNKKVIWPFLAPYNLYLR